MSKPIVVAAVLAALAALLLQALAPLLQVRAHEAAWDEAAAICHGNAGDDPSPGAAGDDADRGTAACPICLAFQQLGKLVAPGAAVTVRPPAPAPRALASPDGQSVGGHTDRPHFPRGPPISG